VALQLPHVESVALPVDIFNALALVKTEDNAAKAQLRGAIAAATRRCEHVTLFPQWGDLRLHIDALEELLRLLPNVRRLGPLNVSTNLQVTQQMSQLISQTMTRGDGATSPVSNDAMLRDGESRLRELHLTGPLSRTALATVGRACPHLRVLDCAYGGTRPLVRMDPTAPLQFIPLMSEAVFIDWLGAILDVSAAKYLTTGVNCAAAAHATGQQQQMLRHLRQLRVANPPFDGERDAAVMDTLECVRAQSHVLITFK
jgi:hypothetical protein